MAFKSSAVTTSCTLSTARPLSSQTQDEHELAFSFLLSITQDVLEVGVGISSTEVAGEAVLTVSVLETMGVTEANGVTKRPFLVIHTVLFPRLDSDSSFFILIFAYKSLLNLVVISTRRKHL